MSWKRIDQEKPAQDQAVFYWFGFFDVVYEGFYEKVESRRGISFDCFYGDHGSLVSDVTFWKPRNEGDLMPAPPSLEEKAACRYHPIAT